MMSDFIKTLGNSVFQWLSSDFIKLWSSKKQSKTVQNDQKNRYGIS